jgi:hypothetical protein
LYLLQTLNDISIDSIEKRCCLPALPGVAMDIDYGVEEWHSLIPE